MTVKYYANGELYHEEKMKHAKEEKRYYRFFEKESHNIVKMYKNDKIGSIDIEEVVSGDAIYYNYETGTFDFDCRPTIDDIAKAIEIIENVRKEIN